MMNEFVCVPVCASCQDAGTCHASYTAPKHIEVHEHRVWAPNRLEYVKLPCGCRTIPWPLHHVLGENFYSIYCDKHGWQKLSRTYKADAIKQARKLKEKSEEARMKASQLTMDEIQKLNITDPPPF